MRNPGRRLRLLAAAMILFFTATPSLAVRSHASPADPVAPVHPDEPALLSQDARWAGLLVIIILGGFFLPAAIIGPAQRALIGEPQDPDESPASFASSTH